jgi:hypothetical protein
MGQSEKFSNTNIEACLHILIHENASQCDLTSAMSRDLKEKEETNLNLSSQMS